MGMCFEVSGDEAACIPEVVAPERVVTDEVECEDLPAEEGMCFCCGRGS